MKNIHILPTDKPSRLYTNMQGVLSKDELKMRLKNYNIYITSDEDIKEGDWFIYKNEIIHRDKGDVDSMWVEAIKNGKKIILTTDVDLIKDGVQAIDDEFLEWFVKNPSCEEVKILRCPIEGTYTLDIPKEEKTKCYCGHTTTCDCGPEETEQETLEDTIAQKIRFQMDIVATDFENNVETSMKVFYKVLENLLFEAEKEQQKRSYSEEEVMNMFHNLSMHLPLHYEFLVKEQFKKK